MFNEKRVMATMALTKSTTNRENLVKYLLPYKVINGCLYKEVTNKGGITTKKLCTHSTEMQYQIQTDIVEENKNSCVRKHGNSRGFIRFIASFAFVLRPPSFGCRKGKCELDPRPYYF